MSVGRITGITTLFGISINQNGTKIVTCGDDNRICIFELQKSSFQ